jgi:hypothetical protein
MSHIIGTQPGHAVGPRLDSIFRSSDECVDRDRAAGTCNSKRNFRLKTPVTVGSYFGEWRVTWAGGGPGTTSPLPRDGCPTLLDGASEGARPASRTIVAGQSQRCSSGTTLPSGAAQTPASSGTLEIGPLRALVVGPKLIRSLLHPLRYVQTLASRAGAIRPSDHPPSHFRKRDISPVPMLARRETTRRPSGVD